MNWDDRAMKNHFKNQWLAFTKQKRGPVTPFTLLRWTAAYLPVKHKWYRLSEIAKSFKRFFPTSQHLLFCQTTWLIENVSSVSWMWWHDLPWTVLSSKNSKPSLINSERPSRAGFPGWATTLKERISKAVGREQTSLDFIDSPMEERSNKKLLTG